MRPYPLCYDPGWSSKVPVDSNRIVTEFFKRHENFQSFLCTFYARLMSPAPLQFQKATTSNQCVYLLAGGTMPLLACHLFHILAHQGSAKRRERHPAAARGTLKPTSYAAVGFLLCDSNAFVGGQVNADFGRLVSNYENAPGGRRSNPSQRRYWAPILLPTTADICQNLAGEG